MGDRADGFSMLPETVWSPPHGAVWTYGQRVPVLSAMANTPQGAVQPLVC